MAKIIRPFPRRNAGRYEIGTTLTYRNGRKFEVVGVAVEVWDDPSYGHGAGDWVFEVRHAWKEVTNGV